MSIKGPLACIAALLGAGFMLYREPVIETPATARERTGQAVERSFTVLAEASPVFGAMPEQRADPPSFPLAADGSLAINERTSTLLDVLLAGLPHHPGRVEVDQIEKRMTAGLPAQAAQQLARLLRTYVAYRDAETELSERQRADATLTPELALDQLHALRVAHFGEQLAGSLYREEEKQMRADLAATRPGAPRSADTQERGLAADPALDRLRNDVAALRKAGAPEARVTALRTQMLGADRAQQLHDTELVQSDWEQRSRTFLAAAQPGVDMEALLRDLYSEQEMPAARAYNLERLRSQQAAGAQNKQ
ncbi:lipase secretion chaperone [Massilia sp. CCM 9210]|uniref:lipase secretion chaperone n=1 Tax=Massilia scottii TaxID=3057166 RepID=UPI00279647F7|nr:lipase secretion chaperone [Massilia sp. CCM 9210]MDQ1815938.1 lipase secretion chaperone [Massilia sp. CCM 9210]